MNEPMTLLERLENPEWQRSPDPRDGPWLKTGLTMETMKTAAVEIKRLRLRIADLEVAAILKMTDDEVVAKCIAEGENPEEVVAKMQTLFEQAFAKANLVRDLAILNAGEQE